MTRGRNLLNSISVLMRQKLSIDYELEPINLIEEIKKVQKSILEVFTKKRINIKTIKQPSRFVILADALFEQLLFNLLVNAAKYDDHDTVNIDIKLETDTEDKSCLISIIDRTHGIPPEYRETVFDRFFEFKKKGKGSGLGLFIVTPK